MKINIFKITNIILGVGIFFVCALLAKEAIVVKYKPLTLETGTGSQETVAKPSGGKDFSHYQIIADSGIFGEGELTLLDNSSANSVNASTNITLVGTVVGMPGVNYAIFYEKQSGKQDIFSKGEKVFNIGELTAVEENRAILSSNGKKSAFYILPADKLHSAPIAPVSNSAPGESFISSPQQDAAAPAEPDSE